MKIIQTVVGVTGLCMTALILYLHFAHRDSVAGIPHPTGPYAVGITSAHLIDVTRIEPHQKNSQNKRELMLNIWYPTEHSSQKPRLLLDSKAVPIIKEDLQKLINKNLATQSSANTLNYLDTLTGNSIANAPITTPDLQRPVIIFSPGLGMPVILYSSLLEELASHGSVVIGVNYPYITNPVIFPNGSIIKQIDMKQLQGEKRDQEYRLWIEDIQYIISQLPILQKSGQNNIWRSIDHQRIAVMGHSFGGSVAIGVSKIDPRIMAGVDIEGKLRADFTASDIDKPFLFVAAPHEEEIVLPLKNLAKNMRYGRYVELTGADHGSFTDIYLVAPGAGAPHLDPRKGIEITRALLVDFFDTYLKQSFSFKQAIEKKYPDVIKTESTHPLPQQKDTHTLLIHGIGK